MQKVVLASHNPGKLDEYKNLLEDCAFQLIPQSELAVSDVEETGLSFVENAILKARHACEHTGLAAIADDSGIEVDALQGAPGIYSARYAGKDRNPEANIDKLLNELNDVTEDKRTARFQCVIVFMQHANDPAPIISQGTWEGKILRERQGQQGFGYDPVFYVPSHQCSAAELPPEEKNKISHRGQALQMLLKKLPLII